MRLNRTRLKGQEGDEESLTGLSTLYEVLLSMTILMAPFTPFLTEFLYQHLRKIHPNFTSCSAAASSSISALPLDAIGKADSVHYIMLPIYDEARLNPLCEERMATLQTVIELGRMVRERSNINLKTPVKEVIVVSKDQGRMCCHIKLQKSGFLYAQALRRNEVADIWNLISATIELTLTTLLFRQARAFGRKRARLRFARAECVVLENQ